MNHPCTTSTPCLPDAPLENLSSERPDSPWYPVINNGFPQPKPPLGGPWKTTHCMGFCASTISQQDADSCAARENIKCRTHPVDPTDPNDPGGGWTRPDMPSGKPLPADQQPPGGGSKPIPTFESPDDDCTVYCADGTDATGHSGAGEFLHFSQNGANIHAHQEACIRALKNRICFDTIEKHGCLLAPYKSTLKVLGFSPPYSFSISSGELPPGIKITDATADSVLFSGTPVEAGSYPFEVTANDLFGTKKAHAFKIDILGLSGGSDTDYPDAQVGEAYSWQFEADGGSEPYTFKLDGYADVNGIVLDEDGFFHGIPHLAQIKDFTVLVTDATGRQCYEYLSLNIQAPLITEFGCAEEQSAILFSGYQGQTPPVTFAPQYGQVPIGMNLIQIDNFTAMLDGLPFPPGVYEFTLRATDSHNVRVDQPVRYYVLGILSDDPVGTVDSPMSFQLEALGGMEPDPVYTFQLISGSMPTGLTLHSSGLIDGTPTVHADTTVVIRVRDQTNHACQRNITFHIHQKPGVNFSNLSWHTDFLVEDGACDDADKDAEAEGNGSTAFVYTLSCPNPHSSTCQAELVGTLNYNGPEETQCRITVQGYLYAGPCQTVDNVVTLKNHNGGTMALFSNLNGNDTFDFLWGDTMGGITVTLRADAYTSSGACPPHVGAIAQVGVSFSPT